MKRNITQSHLAFALILGAVWGLGEVVLGVGLKSCARLVSGSLMTGVALFFIAAAWISTKNYFVPILVVAIACIFKLFDAILLSLPVMHGAIGNPIFAFILEGLGFIVLILVFRHVKWSKISSRALLGGGSALIAVALFPLVKFATGVPACVYPNTMIPLSIFFGPVAIAFSAITVPLAFAFSNRIYDSIIRFNQGIRSSLLRNLVSPAALAVCLAMVLLFRMIVT
jgi:hypothetical protein